MSEQAEQAFIKTFANTISSQPVIYADDYQQPPQNSLRKVPVLPIAIPDPPERKQEVTESSASISITFKSLKPPQSFTLSVQPTDTISHIKSLIASQPRAPPANAQRLLLKGKALADGKLLKEYNVKDGDTVNLMIKPGFEHDPNSPPAPVPEPTSESDAGKLGSGTSRRHQRIPSVVLSPSPSGGSPSLEPRPLDINLTLDTSSIPTASLSTTATHSTYRTIIVDPGYWQRLFSFLKSEFVESDALLAWEDYLRASKGMLTASEIAKIRDHVGVVGMAGT